MRTGYSFIPCTRQMLKSGLLDRTSSIPSLNVSIKVLFSYYCPKTLIKTLIHFFFFLWTVNFSYPSLEEPKPPVAPEPQCEVTAMDKEPSVPVLVNGMAPAESPTTTTSVLAQTLPDIVDSPVTSSTTSGPDLSKMGLGGATSSQSAATAKAFPQVFDQS